MVWRLIKRHNIFSSQVGHAFIQTNEIEEAEREIEKVRIQSWPGDHMESMS